MMLEAPPAAATIARNETLKVAERALSFTQTSDMEVLEKPYLAKSSFA
jgi:hypothetical protein